MKNKFGKKYSLLILGIIIIFGALIRLFAIRTAGFDYDQEYAANFAWRVVREYPIQMIGQNLSVEGLFMGPWYFYFLVPFYLLTGLHPIGGVYGSIVLGLITIAVYYFVFKEVFGLRAAIIASILRASLMSFIGPDLAVTPAFSADLPAILTWFCFYKYWKGNLNFFIPLSFLFGLYTSYHPILFPFYFVFLILLAFKRSIPNRKIMVISFLVFLIPIAPLLRFEYYHNFLEIKRLFSLGSGKGDPMNARDYPRLAALLNFSFINPIFTFVGDYSRNYTSAFGKMSGFIFYLPLLFFTYLKRGFWRDKFHGIVFISTFFIFIGYYFFLPVTLTEYYLLAINTLFFIYAVASFSSLRNNLIVFTVVGFLVFLNLYQILLLTERTNSATLFNKDNIVKDIKNHTAEHEEFFVSYIASPGFKFGYPYLFKIYNRVPSNNPQPRTFNIVSPKSMVGDKFDYESGDIGLIYPK